MSRVQGGSQDQVNPLTPTVAIWVQWASKG